MFHPHLNHPGGLFSLLTSKTTEGTPDVQDRIGTISTSKLIKLEIFPKVGGEYSQKCLKAPPRTSIWLYCWKIIHWKVDSYTYTQESAIWWWTCPRHQKWWFLGSLRVTTSNPTRKLQAEKQVQSFSSQLQISVPDKSTQKNERFEKIRNKKPR